jgi:hypothetical protein
MRYSHVSMICIVTALLAACAGSVSAPKSIQSLSAMQRNALRLSEISADAADGVQMGDTDFQRISALVRNYIQTDAPDVLGSGNMAYRMKIHFTRYDRGSALARGLLIGLGQIRIEGTVYIIDPAGQPVGQYSVSKDFALGGVVGATTSVEDVEQGFAKSVAEIVKPTGV